jgi:hypothetical protein
MGPWFEPGPGSQIPFPNQSVTSIFALRPIDYWSFGPWISAPMGWLTIHRSPVQVLPGTPPFPLLFNRLRRFSRGDPWTYGLWLGWESRWMPHKMARGWERRGIFEKADAQISSLRVRCRPILLKNSKFSNREKPFAF